MDGGNTVKKQENYLDFIPRVNVLFEWEKNEEGKIEIKVHNKGFYRIG